VKAGVDEVVEDLDHADLNRLAFFATQNPSSENIARYLYEALAARWKVANCRVQRVCVAETPGTSATYWEDVNG
jgi:6-pyruvoyltetrahydropterin/6-carboxytetrahydropterin synthase